MNTLPWELIDAILQKVVGGNINATTRAKTIREYFIRITQLRLVCAFWCGLTRQPNFWKAYWIMESADPENWLRKHAAPISLVYSVIMGGRRIANRAYIFSYYPMTLKTSPVKISPMHTWREFTVIMGTPKINSFHFLAMEIVNSNSPAFNDCIVNLITMRGVDKIIVYYSNTI